MSRLLRASCAIAVLVANCSSAFAQSSGALPEIVVGGSDSATTAPIKERYQLPQTVESTTAERIETVTNARDAADTIKYLPSLLVRKRNDGDYQQVLMTRYWGPNSSARTLIYADDILLSALIGNNNSAASSRWSLVNPDQIQRVDMMYGPFSAMYPGNSMGGVLLFTTKMPDKPLVSIKQTESLQTFSFYNTKDTYKTDQTAVSFGNRWDKLSVYLGASFQNSYSQPLTWVTTANAPLAGTTGVINQPNRTNTSAANVLGAGSLLHTQQSNVNFKTALDLTPWLRASYMLSFFNNDQNSRVESYLRDAAGNPTFGGVSAGSSFASNNYSLLQQNLAQAMAVKTDTRGTWDWDITVTRFDYLSDRQRNPFTVTTTGLGFTDRGRLARMDGTNWTTVDARAIWRPDGIDGPHEVFFGVHVDRYVLNNPTWQTSDWRTASDATGSLYSRGDGKTHTVGLWAQDVWRFTPAFKLTTGVRWETWRAFDGYNLSTTTNSTTGAIIATSELRPPSVSDSRTSPKASLSWEPNRDWTVTGSFGIANRFPTVGELYQVTTVGALLVNPNPNLKAERALAEEIAIERKLSGGKIRLSFFHDDTYDAIISQNAFSSATNTTTSFNVNVDHIRNRGIELAWQNANLPIDKVELFGSVTYADSVIVSNPSFVGTNGSTSTGKRAPYVPAWRTTLGATWRPSEPWAVTVAGRYQSKMYATLDNTDYVQNVYQAFDPFFVVDTRVQWKARNNAWLAFGIDNVTNTKYHLFHPFPQRTYVVQGKVTF
jgi:iron complex outermembrane receptor protein